MLLAANCGGGGDQDNPPPPHIVIDSDSGIVDVGETFVLDASGTTDPNGQEEDLQFQWRIVSGGIETTDFQDHCREDFDQICDENDNDHCSNDSNRLCHVDDDCLNVGTCELNSGTTSPDCDSGVCGLGEGDEGPVATFVANVAGPFSVRLTAIGDESNATRTITLNTYPSLFVVGSDDGTGSILQFGGTEGTLVGEVADADEFATDPIQGESDPTNGNLVVIDASLHVLRVFDLRTGESLGAFGESDRFVNDPVALTFNAADGRLYVAEAGGRVLVFDDETGLLIKTFGEIGASPVSMKFSPTTGDLYVVYGNSGVRVFNSAGVAQGILGDTAAATQQAVDLDFLPNGSLLIADLSGKVVRCDDLGENCSAFSAQLDNLLAAGSPTGIAVNPSADATEHDVLVSDPVEERVIACSLNGTGCETFGDSDNADSTYEDLFFAPPEVPTTTSSTTSTTLEEGN